MKLLSAKVVDGHLDLPEDALEDGVTVTILIPESSGGFDLTDDQRRELTQALAEADRGEGVDGWQLLQELDGD
jgi:hypothetical protein